MIETKDILATDAPSLRQAITRYFEEAIRGGSLPPGTVLPSSRELAQRLNTSCPNVHQALVPLVKAGLIERDRKRGTTVLEVEKHLKCVVIYVFHYSLDDLPPFQHCLIEQLGRQLEAAGIEPRVVVDNASQYGLRQMQKWALSGKIQGILPVFGGTGMKMLAPKLAELPVVMATPDDAVIDLPGMIQGALEHLRSEGVRKVGMITTVEHYSLDAAGNRHESAFYQAFVAAAERLGLEWSPEHLEMIATPEEYLRTGSELAEFGFTRGNRLFGRPAGERPEGVLVFPDQLITGVTLSIFQRHLRVPEDLKLVLHRNWEIGTTILTPCAQVGFSVAEVARSMVDHLRRRFSGERPAPERVGHTLRTYVPTTMEEKK